MKKALASARDELAAAQELRRSDRDNLRTAQQAAKRDIKAAERMADQANHAARAECEWRIGEMRAKMQAELRLCECDYQPLTRVHNPLHLVVQP